MATKQPRKRTTKRKASAKKKLWAHAEHTADAVVFGFNDAPPGEETLDVLLIQREEENAEGEPNVFPGWWALPGGYIQIAQQETSFEAAQRELEEETGVRGPYLEQLATFDDPDRDPRGRVISVAHFALVRSRDLEPKRGSDAKEVGWFNVRGLPKKLAFDHENILEVALKRLQGKVRYQPIGFELLPEKFKLSQLQRLYEVILGVEIDKRNFRRKILAFDFLQPLDEYAATTKRQAQLFRFDRKAYDRLVKSGFNFEV